MDSFAAENSPKLTLHFITEPVQPRQQNRSADVRLSEASLWKYVLFFLDLYEYKCKCSDRSRVPFPSSQDIRYCLDSQYCSSERALLLFQVLSAVLRRAFSPKIRSIPEQLLKECSRSTVDSVTGGQQAAHRAELRSDRASHRADRT